MAVKFTSEQRRLAADKLMDFGNLGAVATVITQFVTPERFNVFILLFGISFFDYYVYNWFNPHSRR